MLYLGPRVFPSRTLPNDQFPKAPARRAQSHVVTTLQNMSHHASTSQQSSPQAAANIADLPTYHFFPELAASFSDPELAFQRGIFQRISAATIDLPSHRPPPNPSHADLWIQRLPDNVKPFFQHPNNPLREAIRKHLNIATTAQPLPSPVLYASPTEYTSLLAKLEDAGMLHWSIVAEEDPQYSATASSIEMTLFAVTKSQDRSRLISWPRVQNEATPQPPHTSLPTPTMFEAIRLQGRNPGAFFFDISNMFHNITLPLWLARLLPLQPVQFSSLPAQTQRRIMERTTIPPDKSNLLLRPCQATLPMGFKWAVFIAHHFVSSCVDESFHLLKSTTLALPNMKLTKLRGEDAPFILSKHTPMLLHIIDDAAVLTVDWPTPLISTWHRLIRRILHLNHLPIATSKSSSPNAVIRDSVTFIGCIWNLQTGTIAPSPDKLERVTARALALLEAQTSTSKDWLRITGKLLWFATLNRPLLACTQAIFHHSNATLPPSSASTIPFPSKRELRTLTALLPFASVDIHLPISHIIVAFDASLTSGAVTYAHVPQHLAERLWAAAQAAKFQRNRDHSMQLPEVTQIVQQCTWKLAFIHKWRKTEHINCLEAATAVLAAEWLTRNRMGHTRAIFLTDSLVTLGAFQKGRSSRPGLLLRCRRFAAIVLAHNIRVTLCYVCSAMNPVDPYTRLTTVSDLKQMR